MSLENAHSVLEAEVKQSSPSQDTVHGVDEKRTDGDSESDIPDGGFWAWSTLFGAVLIQFAAGYVNAFGVYQDFFVRTFLTDFSSSQISWIGSIATFIALSGGALCGRLFDRGYFHYLILVGGTLTTFALFMLSLAKPQQYYQVFLSLGLALGLGTGIIYVPAIAVTAHHFRRKRAFAMGVAAAGTSLGALLHPIMLNNLIHGALGFGNGVRASAGLVGGTLLLGGLLTRTRGQPKKEEGRVGLWTAAKKFSKDEVYVFAVIGTFLVVQGVFFPLFYMQLYSDQKGLDTTFGFYSLSILNFASFIGRLIGGAFVPRFGVFNVIIFSTFVCSVLLFSMLAVVDIAGVVVFSLLYGFFSGVYVTLLGPMFSSLSEDVSELGARMGIGYAFTGLGSLIGTPITGALLSRNFTWWRPIVYTGVMSLGGMFFFMCSRFVLVRRKGTQRC